jgi:hypothetical protein
MAAQAPHTGDTKRTRETAIGVREIWSMCGGSTNSNAKRPNQAIQPTAGRSDVPLHFMKTRSLQITLALAGGG